MTSQSPRIYIYKITFEEVLYYYYGVHKEKTFNDYYMGSPVTHKWVWDFYTPKKQILEVFPYTDEGWLEAQKVETRLIKPFYNTDKWCLNENVGGSISLKISRDTGKKVALKHKENGTGIFSLSRNELSDAGKKGGKNCTKKMKENKMGIFSLTTEELSDAGKKGGEKTKQLGIGIHALTFEQKSKNSKRVHSQKWMCTETSFISSISALTKYQRNRGIDTSKRVKVS